MTRRVLSATIEDERACGLALAADGGGSSNRDQQDDAPRPEAPDSPGSSFDDPFQLGLGRSGGSGGGSGRPGGGPGRRGPSRVSWLYILLVCGLLAYVIFSMNGGLGAQSPTDELATSEFVTAVEEGRVANVTYTVADGSLAGEYWTRSEDIGKNAALEHFTSTYVGSDALADLMAGRPSTVYIVNTNDPNAIMDFLISVVPTVILVLIMLYFMRQMMGANSKTMQFGKTNAKMNEATRPKVKFADVAGIDEAVEELEEVRDFLADPERYRKLGAKIPRGVLLVGPPGTGKTLLAKAVAGEAGVPFFSISGSDFVEMFVGVGASRVRDLFSKAKEQAPSIIFIDEIDAVGRQRGAGLGGGHDEREQTLNQLLVEMDGFDNDTNLIIIAATNRPDVLDPALLRPGRFDRQVAVEAPDLEGREAILKVHAKGKPFVPDVDLHAIAVRTPGFTGADLANVLNEAALLCARAGAQLIDNRAIDEAIDRVMSGPKRKSKGMALDELRNTAYHEGGHALVAAALHHTDPVTKITILPRGRALGYTAVMPTEDRYSQSRNQLLDQMAYAMGGRTAEEIVFHDPTTGASNDIEKATAIARKMVVEYGFSSQLGAIKWADDDDQTTVMDGLQPRKYSDRTAEIIDQEVLKLVETAHTEAWTILNENRDILDELVRQLLVKQTLNEKEVAAIFANIRKAPEREVWLSNEHRPDSDLPPVPIPESLKRSVGMGAGE